MSFRKFKFVSPGIFINEIDNSQLTAIPEQLGPVLIGRTERGPALRPVQVDSFAEFVEVFGNPIPGGRGGDVFRDGNYTAPTYAAYAAQAWLRNNSPATIVRLLGKEHSDRSTAGRAGWMTQNADGTISKHTTTAATNGGAFGLWIAEYHGGFNNQPTGSDAGIQATGTLGAIFYVDNGTVQLRGPDLNGVNITGSGVWIKSVDTNNTFKILIKDKAGTPVADTAVDFTETSRRHIRKVLNTNPTLLNGDIYSNTTNYFVGETFEGNLKQFSSGNVSGRQYGLILPLSSGSAIFGGDFRNSTTPASTGWVISQNLSANTGSFNPEAAQKLFRFKSMDTGVWDQKNLKISIKDIKRSTDPENKYGTFSVIIRDIKDTDNNVRILEQFNNCSLNPYSDNYVAKKVGDTFIEWSDSDRRYKTYGDFPNRSKFIRVDINDEVAKAAVKPESLPFGFFGPLRFNSWAVSGSSAHIYDPAKFTIHAATDAAARQKNTLIHTGAFAGQPNPGSWPSYQFVSGAVEHGYDHAGSTGLSGTINVAFEFPKLRLRISSSEGNVPDPTNSYWGEDTTFNSTRFDKSIRDMLRIKPYGIANENVAATHHMHIFTLDDVRNSIVMDTEYTGSLTDVSVYESGSYIDGRSYTSHNQSSTYPTASYANVLDAGVDRFTMCLHGGADGLDIREREPFRNSALKNKTQFGSAAYNSIKVAIDSCRDPEQVEFDTIAMPGLTNSTLNVALMNLCEERGDSLAVIDLEGGFEPDTESTSSVQDRRGSVQTTVNNLRDIGVNTSYGCAYYPWVQIRDNINGATLWAPPSVAALGAMSFGQSTQELWFAPAGFTRGGLSQGAAGIPVVGVRQKLTSKERDTLYDANINPIASFPSEGIVIFGQKTLQVTPSALDRINVRRLLIFLKKQISRFAATILFDQNVQTTWNRFRGRVEPFLSSVKSRLGITDYRLILDESTTTPDLIDRNILYAKIFLKPARAIEFIALDFVITDSGASFND